MADTEKTGAEARQPEKKPVRRRRQSKPASAAKPAEKTEAASARNSENKAQAQKPAEAAPRGAAQDKGKTRQNRPPRQRQNRQPAVPADAEQGGRQSKLKIIPLGGLGEIGKNMTAYEYGNDIIVVDCGMGFPDEDMYGIDVVIPDISYLKANAGKIRGMVITHGHEDHIGAIPYVISELDVPIYATALTNAIIELKLDERDLLKNTQIFTKKPGDRFSLGAASTLS
jgi:ribonuclease J